MPSEKGMAESPVRSVTMTYGPRENTMTLSSAIRSRARFATIVAGILCLRCPLPLAQATHPQPSAPAPIERRPPSTPQVHPPQTGNVTAPRPAGKLPNGQHLAGWLDQHSSQSQTQRIQSLEKEPGFHDLPAPTQQRMRERLTQLDNMPPQQRDRIISRTEVMEHLTPEQRGQVRSTMEMLSSLPPASRHAVSRTFRTLRGMPPQQRLNFLNTPDIRSQFTEQERTTLTNLMAVEPYLPPRAADSANPQ